MVPSSLAGFMTRPAASYLQLHAVLLDTMRKLAKADAIAEIESDKDEEGDGDAELHEDERLFALEAVHMAAHEGFDVPLKHALLEADKLCPDDCGNDLVKVAYIGLLRPNELNEDDDHFATTHRILLDYTISKAPKDSIECNEDLDAMIKHNEACQAAFKDALSFCSSRDVTMQAKIMIGV